MAINKVVANDEILIDLTNDTVVADALIEGYTAHGANGETVNGGLKLDIYATKSYVDQNFYDKPTVDSEFKSFKSIINNQLEGKQPKGDYLLSADLSTAINDALVKAKTSGEFNGKDGARGYSLIWGNLSQVDAVSDTHATISSIIKNHTRIAAPVKNAGAFKPKDIALLTGQYNDEPRQKYIMLFEVDKVVGSQLQGYPLSVIENGVNGTNGKTPVKGVDYFTEADKAELVNELRTDVFELTLTTDWLNNIQIVSNSNLKADGYAYIYSPTPTDVIAYAQAGIYADDVSVDGQMKFHCENTPAKVIKITVLGVKI